MAYKTYMTFDDRPDVVIPVKQKYKIMDPVKLNDIEYEVYNIIVGKGFTEYGCTRKVGA